MQGRFMLSWGVHTRTMPHTVYHTGCTWLYCRVDERIYQIGSLATFSLITKAEQLDYAVPHQISTTCAALHACHHSCTVCFKTEQHSLQSNNQRVVL